MEPASEQATAPALSSALAVSIYVDGCAAMCAHYGMRAAGAARSRRPMGKIASDMATPQQRCLCSTHRSWPGHTMVLTVLPSPLAGDPCGDAAAALAMALASIPHRG